MSKKKIVFILIALVLTIAGIVAGVYLVRQRQEIRKKAAPATAIYFQPSTVETLVGETMELDIFVETGTNNIYSLFLEINYDSAILEAKLLTFTSLLSDQLRLVNISPGKITGSAGTGRTNGAANPPVSGKQKIASVSFKILSTSSSTAVSFGPETAAYTGIGEDIGANLISSTIPATITVQAQEPTTTPTPTGGVVASLPTPTSTSTPTSTPNSPTPTPTPTSSGTGGVSLLTSTPMPTASTGSNNAGGAAATPTSTPIPQEVPVTGNLSPTLFLLILGSFFIFAFLFAL